MTYASASQGPVIVFTSLRSSLYMFTVWYSLERSTNSSQIPNCLKRAATEGPIAIAEPTNDDVSVKIELSAEENYGGMVPTKWFELSGLLEYEEWNIASKEKQCQSETDRKSVV